MKKLIATLLAVIMVISLAACGGSGSGGATTAAGGGDATTAAGGGETPAATETGRYPSFKIAVNADPTNLNPTNGNGNPKTLFYHSIYEALFDYDDDNNFVPSLGKSITCVDSLHYQVEIYDCIYDSNGNHITADDVVYSVNWLVESGECPKYEVFDSIKKIDDYTVEWTWKFEPTSWDELEFPMTRTWIFSQKEMENGNFATAPVGTGAYVVKSYVPGSSVVLEANDDYWLLKNPEIMDTHLDIHRANVQTVEFLIIAEAAQAQIALEQGTVDYCEYIQTMAMPEFEEGGPFADKYTAEELVQGDYIFVHCNCWDTKLTSDVNLRKAIWYAIDSAAVCVAMGGNYAPMDTIGNSAYPDWDDSMGDQETYMNTYDPDLAKDYLSKSNYKGEELTLICESNEAQQNAAVMIQAQLDQIGIKVKINALANSLMRTTEADHDAWEISIASIGGPSLVGSYNRLMGNGTYEIDGKKYNVSFVSDDKMQELYETAKADATHDTEHIQEAIDYTTKENAFFYALAQPATAIVCSKNVAKLYKREHNFTIPTACEFVGYAAEHSANVTPLDVALPEPSGLPNNVHIFYQVFNPEDGAGIVWKLTVNPDDSWTLEVKSTKPDIEPAETITMTGDKNFPGDGPNQITTVPPEGSDFWKEHADWYEDDGVCKWEILDNNGLVPVNFKDYEKYKADWESGAFTGL
ncbi:MAG: ABC transporter substrate-binding protein [Lachnospiraceae bacterium]|nr:ABC transporter substrate-binding protein [Lachnospiraceae bacterium]